jgi:hypothetical protein
VNRRWFAVAANVVLALVIAAPQATIAESTPAPGSGETACGVRVAFVTPLDAHAMLQAVVLEGVSGASALAGSVALFTSANRRYDVPFDGSSAGASDADAPLVVLVRFPAGATITGAYVASLAGTPPLACGLGDPWTAGMAPDDAATRAIAAALAEPFFDRNAVAVAGPGVPDPLPCRTRFSAARIVHEVPPALSFFADAADLPHGTISVRVVVGADGHAFDAHIDRANDTMNETAAGTTIESTAVEAAMHSTYAPATFRCRPIRGIAYYTITYRSRT